MSLRRILKTDPFHDAEQVTGKRYKDDAETMALGVLGHMQNVADRRSALELTGDTTHSMKVPAYLAVVEKIGFKSLLVEPFVGVSCGREMHETFHVLFHEAFGILLSFDTYYDGDSVNGGNFSYNWCSHDPERAWHRCLSSGGCDKDGIWAGYHDCREAVKFHIEELRRYGSFVTPWVDVPSRWLTTWADHKREPSGPMNFEHEDRISAERAARLPEHVRKMIGRDERGEIVIGRRKKAR